MKKCTSWRAEHVSLPRGPSHCLRCGRPTDVQISAIKLHARSPPLRICIWWQNFALFSSTQRMPSTCASKMPPRPTSASSSLSSWCLLRIRLWGEKLLLYLSSLLNWLLCASWPLVPLQSRFVRFKFDLQFPIFLGIFPAIPHRKFPFQIPLCIPDF